MVILFFFDRSGCHCKRATWVCGGFLAGGHLRHFNRFLTVLSQGGEDSEAIDRWPTDSLLSRVGRVVCYFSIRHRLLFGKKLVSVL